jgi:hypothetical protein
LPQKIKPDFGLPADFLDGPNSKLKKRDLHQSRRMRSRRRAVPVLFG